MKILDYMWLFLIFPGFIFSSTMGLIVGWVDRKVTARVQWRVGPPWYQNFLDVAKLAIYKETLIPKGVSKALFLGVPLVALASATLASTIIFTASIMPEKSFVGDVIVVVYLLLIPPVALMLGGFASGNALASLGASREMKLMMAYELPFILALTVIVIKCGYAIKFSEIIAYQDANRAVISSWAGAASFIVMLACIQAKLGCIPFDMSEAETEIISGPYIEYSGKPLAIFRLTKAVLLFCIPALVVTLYFGGFKSDLEGFLRNILQYLLVVVIIVLVKNTNPRVRIDQALGFFWKPVTALAILSVVLAILKV